MRREEITRKLGIEVARDFEILQHDFVGPDIRDLGWLGGGPVCINRHFLEADVRICVGTVLPHSDAGFGGGSKLVVPGVAGHASIAHLHGALPPRPAGQLEETPGIRDRRSWSEQVARSIGIDAVVCGVVNSQAELVDLHVGDLVEAQRRAARRASEVGRTLVPRELVDRCDVALVNAYPLDSDPMQMGKSMRVTEAFPKACTVVVDAASDATYYHGLFTGGRGRRRLLRNAPALLASPRRQLTWLRSLRQAVRPPGAAARVKRLTQYTLSALPYGAYRPGAESSSDLPSERSADPFILSEGYPPWAVERGFPNARLYARWADLSEALARRFGAGRAVVLPCAPLQLIELV
jgi:hypothetical protein